ncbi:hypothetical protein ACFV2N_33070 [Streptomyces sp. NPDC059680]|uniref:hypothetical protein n=1 Tax=Streptomyces sp. NPDC059680 TaxID=3346904 RepID=UPI00369A0FD1
MVGATINRYAPLHDNLSTGLRLDAEHRPRIEAAADGRMRPMGEPKPWGAARLEDPERRALVLAATRRTGSVPSLLGISAHVLTAGMRPEGSCGR